MSSFCKGSLRGNHTGHKAKGQVTMSVFEPQSLLNAFPPLSKGSVYFRVKMALTVHWEKDPGDTQLMSVSP